jgi:hypothetical protein
MELPSTSLYRTHSPETILDFSLFQKNYGFKYGFIFSFDVKEKLDGEHLIFGGTYEINTRKISNGVFIDEINEGNIVN